MSRKPSLFVLAVLLVVFFIWSLVMEYHKSGCYKACVAAGHVGCQYTINGCECLDKAGPPPSGSD